MATYTPDPLGVVGNKAHDDADSGNPVKLGHKAINHGATPTAVAASDRTDWYANRHGIPFVLNGHPNIVRREFVATTAKTNTAIGAAVGANDRMVVTEIEVLVSNATTVNVGVRIGFGTEFVPAEPADGSSVDGMVLTHPGIAAGSGVVAGSGAGIVAIGGKDEELRITCGEPTTGRLRVIVSFFLITET